MKRTRIKPTSQRIIAKIKKELDILWSRFIRQRDKICQRCNKAPASQAAHIFSRNNLSTRWHPLNGIGMCYYCHIIWAHREPVEFTEWIQNKLGMKYSELKLLASLMYSETNLKDELEVQRIKNQFV